MKKLSIIVLFCDKDRNFLVPLLRKIDKNVKVDHEVICVNNSAKAFNKTDPITKTALFISPKKNIGTLAGRKFGLKFAFGHYVWFIDVDDDIPKIKFFPKKDYDIIQFGYRFYTSEKKYIFTRKKKYELKDIPYDGDFIWCNAGPALWNKWFDRFFLTKIYNQFSDEEIINSQEDFLLNSLAFKAAKKVLFSNKTIYYYNAYNSSGNSQFITLDKFEYLITGYKDAVKIYRQKIKSDLNENDRILNYEVFINCLLKCKLNTGDRLGMLMILKNTVDSKMFLNYLITHNYNAMFVNSVIDFFSKHS